MIATDIDFIRVDLYTDKNNVYCGECTVYPDAGFGKFSPPTYDLEVGKMWNLAPLYTTHTSKVEPIQNEQ